MTTPTIRTAGQVLAVIGCGTMGSAILAGVLKSCNRAQSTDAEPRIAHFIACVNSVESVQRLEGRFSADLDRVSVVWRENVAAMKQADIVLLACKPYMIDAVLGEKGVREALEGKLVISVIVGTSPAKLYAAIGEDPSETRPPYYVVRAMLNIAAEVGESMTVIERTCLPEEFPDEFLYLPDWIFLQLGKTSVVPSELFDVAGVLAGTSGVFISVALDGILDAAVSQGIRRPEGRKMMAQSLIGLAKLIEQGHTPDELREKTASPRGTTIEGLMSLEADRVRSAYTNAIIKATNKSKNM